MSGIRLRHNVVANFAGQAWNALLQIALIPVYLRVLGPEAYGLVGLFAAVEAVISVLDLGLSTTANRELAWRSEVRERAAESRGFVRTLETVYWGSGLCLGMLVAAAAPPIIAPWLAGPALSHETVESAAVILAGLLAVRTPALLYRAVLLGLQRQVLLNAVAIAAGTVRYAGAAAVLLLVSRDVRAFLGWLLVASAAELVVLVVGAWSSLPRPSDRHKAKVDFSLLRGSWRFVAQMTGTGFLSFLLNQGDRILIGALLPLAQLGYYSVVRSLAGGLVLFVAPVFNAVFPRFSAFLAVGNVEALRLTYHRASTWVTACVAPIAGVLIFFSFDVVLLWTRSEAAADASFLALSFLALGFLLNVLGGIPYALQLSAGLAWIPLYINIASVLMMVPLLVSLVRLFGIAGAGLSFALLNLLGFAVAPVLTHRFVLRGEMRAWLVRDIAPFALPGLFIFYAVSRLAASFDAVGISVILASLGVAVYVLTAWWRFGRLA